MSHFFIAGINLLTCVQVAYSYVGSTSLWGLLWYPVFGLAFMLAMYDLKKGWNA